jgi:hypothetical protein
MNKRTKKNIRGLIMGEIEFLDLEDSRDKGKLLADFDQGNLVDVFMNVRKALWDEYGSKLCIDCPVVDDISRVRTVDQLVEILIGKVVKAHRRR